MQRQFYMLHGWKLSGELTNYRRFFDVDTLIGIRAEFSSVFAATHARIEEMILKDEIEGVRIDHPDGLRRPPVILQAAARITAQWQNLH